MTHRELELHLDAYLDGELAGDEVRELEAHLSECRECARLRETRVALGAAIREQLPALRAPDGLRTRVRAAVRAAVGTPGTSHAVPPGAGSRSRRRSRWWR